MIRARQRGFTLVELIVVIVVSGIVATMLSSFITQPIEGYENLAGRATLVDVADTALRRIQRDVRRALPNSVRITGGGSVLELLHTVDGGRYRLGLPGDVLDFSSADSGFDVLGALGNFSAIDLSTAQLVVYNLAPSGTSSNAYFGDNRHGLSAAGSSASHLQLASAYLFPLTSPKRRFYVVDTPVTFYCDLASGEIRRYDGYAISAVQPAPPAGSGALLANRVSACAFSYQPGTASRSGLVRLSLELTEAGETIRLMHQVHVDNAS